MNNSTSPSFTLHFSAFAQENPLRVAKKPAHQSSLSQLSKFFCLSKIYQSTSACIELTASWLVFKNLPKTDGLATSIHSFFGFMFIADGMRRLYCLTKPTPALQKKPMIQRDQPAFPILPIAGSSSDRIPVVVFFPASALDFEPRSSNRPPIKSAKKRAKNARS